MVTFAPSLSLSLRESAVEIWWQPPYLLLTLPTLMKVSMHILRRAVNVHYSVP